MRDHQGGPQSPPRAPAEASPERRGMPLVPAAARRMGLGGGRGEWSWDQGPRRPESWVLAVTTLLPKAASHEDTGPDRQGGGESPLCGICSGAGDPLRSVLLWGVGGW